MRNKKAYKLYHAGKHKEAEKSLIESLNKNKFQSDFDLNLLGMIHYQSLRYESAIVLFKSAIKLNNQEANYFNNLGATYKDSGQTSLAIESFEEAIRLLPEFPEAYYNLGSTYQLAGDFKQAEFYLKEALNYNKNFTIAKNNLACIDLDLGNVESAIILFDEIVKSEPTNNGIFSNKLF